MIRISTVLLAAVLCTACSFSPSKRCSTNKDYLDTEAGKTLTVPDDLTEPTTDYTYRIPEERKDSAADEDRCFDAPPKMPEPKPEPQTEPDAGDSTAN